MSTTNSALMCEIMSWESRWESPPRMCGWLLWVCWVSGWVGQTLLINRHNIETLMIESVVAHTYERIIHSRYNKIGDRKPHDFDYMIESTASNALFIHPSARLPAWPPRNVLFAEFLEHSPLCELRSQKCKIYNFLVWNFLSTQTKEWFLVDLKQF